MCSTVSKGACRLWEVVAVSYLGTVTNDVLNNEHKRLCSGGAGLTTVTSNVLSQ